MSASGMGKAQGEVIHASGVHEAHSLLLVEGFGVDLGQQALGGGEGSVLFFPSWGLNPLSKEPILMVPGGCEPPNWPCLRISPKSSGISMSRCSIWRPL
jgi:hypothetical protein